jgi:hypothetical protein
MLLFIFIFQNKQPFLSAIFSGSALAKHQIITIARRKDADSLKPFTSKGFNPP